MNERKNTSIRLSDAEKSAVDSMAAAAGLKRAGIIQKAVRHFIRAYKTEGRNVLFEDAAPAITPAEAEAEEVVQRSSKKSHA